MGKGFSLRGSNRYPILPGVFCKTFIWELAALLWMMLTGSKSDNPLPLGPLHRRIFLLPNFF